MRLNLLLGVLLILGMAGCATTRQEQPKAQLQTRVDELQTALDEKDSEIANLKDGVNSLAEQIKDKENTGSSDLAAGAGSSSSMGIIKVSVSAERVQLALQNAGYYHGPLDGKVGEKTRRAIADFQKANSLSADGVIGKKTWATLKTFLD